MENLDFNKLLTDVIENPELILDANTISADQLLEIKKRINPYIGLSNSYDPDNKQGAVCSYTNLKEDYLKRFVVTSVISFIFQMLDEYDVPKSERLWVPIQAESNSMFNIKSLREKLEGIVDVLKEAEEAEIDGNKQIAEFNNMELLENASDDSKESIKKTIYELNQKKVGILYTVTHMIKDMGLLADSKIKITTSEAVKFPEIKKIINAKKHNTDTFSEHEFPNELAKEIISKFLKMWFSFDPSIHIRNGFDKDKINSEIIIRYF